MSIAEGHDLIAFNLLVAAEADVVATLFGCRRSAITMNLKKSVEFTPAKKIQHKFDKLFRLMSRV